LLYDAVIDHHLVAILGMLKLVLHVVLHALVTPHDGTVRALRLTNPEPL